MADPLKQFAVKPLIPIELSNLNLSFTNASLWMLASMVIPVVIMMFMARQRAMVPGRSQNIPEILYEFIYAMVKDTLGHHGRTYMPFVFSLFMMVLVGNLLGMIPFGFTITSHIVVTGALSILVIAVVTIMGFVNHGVKFFRLFAPKGLPAPIYLIIIPVEIVSYLSRPFTLAVRLAANMTAGHTMLKVFAIFSIQAGILAGMGPMLFNAAMVSFEILVAVLQAYIFTILTCMYLKDAVELH